MLPTDPGPDPAARGEAGLGPLPGGARLLLGASSSQRGNAQVATEISKLTERLLSRVANEEPLPLEEELRLGRLVAKPERDPAGSWRRS